MARIHQPFYYVSSTTLDMARLCLLCVNTIVLQRIVAMISLVLVQNQRRRQRRVG